MFPFHDNARLTRREKENRMQSKNEKAVAVEPFFVTLTENEITILRYLKKKPLSFSSLECSAWCGSPQVCSPDAYEALLSLVKKGKAKGYSKNTRYRNTSVLFALA